MISGSAKRSLQLIRLSNSLVAPDCRIVKPLLRLSVGYTTDCQHTIRCNDTKSFFIRITVCRLGDETNKCPSLLALFRALTKKQLPDCAARALM
uniref:Uncharacterized protein n=1 Tax=Anguilla anguilla TaxID=7936 RepID=A0A0E9X2H3_ANGAN